MHPEARGRIPQPELPEDPKTDSLESYDFPEAITELSPQETARQMESSLENPNLLLRLKPEELHERIEEWGNMPEYRRFKHMHLSFDTLDGAAQTFAEYAKRGSHEPLAKELENLVKEIKIAVHRYYNSVMAFERTSIKKFQLERKEYLEELQRIDAKRRTDHNHLIGAVLNLSKL